MSVARPSIASTLRAALRQGPATSGELGEEVGLSAAKVSAHLCRMRRAGVTCVIATRPSSTSRDINIWALVEQGGPSHQREAMQ